MRWVVQTYQLMKSKNNTVKELAFGMKLGIDYYKYLAHLYFSVYVFLSMETGNFNTSYYCFVWIAQ